MSVPRTPQRSNSQRGLLDTEPVAPAGVEMVENFDYYRVAPVASIRGLPPQKIEQSKRLAQDVKDAIPSDRCLGMDGLLSERGVRRRCWLRGDNRASKLVNSALTHTRAVATDVVGLCGASDTR